MKPSRTRRRWKPTSRVMPTTFPTMTTRPTWASRGAQASSRRTPNQVFSYTLHRPHRRRRRRRRTTSWWIIRPWPSSRVPISTWWTLPSSSRSWTLRWRRRLPRQRSRPSTPTRPKIQKRVPNKTPMATMSPTSTCTRATNNRWWTSMALAQVSTQPSSPSHPSRHLPLYNPLHLPRTVIVIVTYAITPVAWSRWSRFSSPRQSMARMVSHRVITSEFSQPLCYVTYPNRDCFYPLQTVKPREVHWRCALVDAASLLTRVSRSLFITRQRFPADGKPRQQHAAAKEAKIILQGQPAQRCCPKVASPHQFGHTIRESFIMRSD